MSDIPTCPADKRPGDKPYYIADTCDECGETLTPDAGAYADGWYDEFRCGCGDIHMDWPQAEFDRLTDRAANAEWIPLEEVDAP